MFFTLKYVSSYLLHMQVLNVREGNSVGKLVCKYLIKIVKLWIKCYITGSELYWTDTGQLDNHVY